MKWGRGYGIIILFLMLAMPAASEERSRAVYPEAGILFSGILVQPAAGFWYGRWGVRISGMYYRDDWYQFHFNLAWAFYDRPEIQQSLTIHTSHIAGSDPGAEYNFWSTGLTYSINFHGLFAELGLGVPWKDNLGNLKNDPVVPWGCLGYIYRFTPRE